MNANHIISSEDLKWGWCVKTNEIKYFFTRGIINNNLYIGSEKHIRLSNVTNEDVKTARQFIKTNGGNIAEDAEVEEGVLVLDSIETFSDGESASGNIFFDEDLARINL